MKKLLIPFFFVGILIMIVVMAKTGAPLKTATTPLGILDLEFAYNTEKATAVSDAWQPAADGSYNRRRYAYLNTYLDFIFLFFYAGFLFLACRKIVENIKGPISKAGIIIASAALLAGIFDILENIGMLITLNDHITGTITFLTTFFSVIKWGLAIIAVLYVLTGTLILAWRKFMN